MQLKNGVEITDKYCCAKCGFSGSKCQVLKHKCIERSLKQGNAIQITMNLKCSLLKDDPKHCLICHKSDDCWYIRQRKSESLKEIEREWKNETV